MVDPNEESVLRAKYRDYCSARVADALLSSSPAEIYSLAEAEARATGRLAPASYNEAIHFATKSIRSRLDLPEFRVWVEEYKSDPGRFDSLLMGLWKSEESPPGDPDAV